MRRGTPPLTPVLLGALLAGSTALATAGGPAPRAPAAPRAAAPSATTPAPPAAAPGSAASALPGVPAPREVVEELRTALARAVQRFEARDLGGLLAYVSAEYRTGPLTKPALRAQFGAMFRLYDAMAARIRLDEVRLVGGYAWIYSTGQASGRLPLIGQWVTLFWWERELEVARRENGVWRLYGYQQ